MVKIFSKFLLYLQQTPGLKLNENNLPYNKLKTPTGYFSSCCCIHTPQTAIQNHTKTKKIAALYSVHTTFT